MLSPVSTSDAHHVVFGKWYWCGGAVGIVRAGGNAPLGIDFYRAMDSKEASVPKPK